MDSIQDSDTTQHIIKSYVGLKTSFWQFTSVKGELTLSNDYVLSFEAEKPSKVITNFLLRLDDIAMANFIEVDGGQITFKTYSGVTYYVMPTELDAPAISGSVVAANYAAKTVMDAVEWKNTFMGLLPAERIRLNESKGHNILIGVGIGCVVLAMGFWYIIRTVQHITN